jgi:hypothetical protein
MTEQQQIAWLQTADFFGRCLAVPAPRFPIGSEVVLTWLDEFDHAHSDQGQIIGLFIAPAGWLAGWWYVIRFDQLNASPCLRLPHVDECHESNLEIVADPN